jgi:hypothetical protein
VRPHIVVVRSIFAQRPSRVGEIDKVAMPEALTLDRVMEALDMGVVRGFPGPAEVEPQIVPVRPVIDARVR